MSPPRPPLPLARLAATAPGRAALNSLVKRFDARLRGAENIPREGAALLAGNHGLLGVDSAVFTALLFREVGRLPRFLGERNLWKIPVLRRALDACGAIPGTPDDAVRLLEEGELVIVYPGGVEDSFKLAEEAYTLKWGERAGFVRVAMRARAPIVPIAATGIDELFVVRGRERVLGRLLFGSSRYDAPIIRNLLPRAVPLEYRALPAIDTSGDPADAATVERARRAAYDAVDSVLARYRAR